MIDEALANVQIPLTFKAKHLFIIAFFLRDGQAAGMFPLLYKIRTAIGPETELEDDVNVTGTIQQIITVVEILGSQKEQEMSGPNKDIQDSMMPQLMDISQNGDGDLKDAVDGLLGLLSSRAGSNAASVNTKIEIGRSFVLAQ